MPVRKKNKHVRRADQNAETRKKKKGGKPRS